jgi:hypothetical protein
MSHDLAMMMVEFIGFLGLVLEPGDRAIGSVMTAVEVPTVIGPPT